MGHVCFRIVKELEVEFIAQIGALSEKLSGFLFPLTVLLREPHCQRGDPFFRSVFNELSSFLAANLARILADAQE